MPETSRSPIESELKHLQELEARMMAAYYESLQHPRFLDDPQFIDKFPQALTEYATAANVQPEDIMKELTLMLGGFLMYQEAESILAQAGNDIGFALGGMQILNDGLKQIREASELGRLRHEAERRAAVSRVSESMPPSGAYVAQTPFI
jgi:hypothetical protein